MPRRRAAGGRVARKMTVAGLPYTVTDVTRTDREPGLARQNPAGKFVRFDPSNAGPIEVKLSGPLFDGRLDVMIGDMLSEMMFVVADQGRADVMQTLDDHIQFPTPYYETQINVAADPRGLVVNDRGIVYGPWLEGVSDRNHSTRFKGYSAFRRSAANLRRKVPTLVAPTAARWAVRMNGS